MVIAGSSGRSGCSRNSPVDFLRAITESASWTLPFWSWMIWSRVLQPLWIEMKHLFRSIHKWIWKTMNIRTMRNINVSWEPIFFFPFSRSIRERVWDTRILSSQWDRGHKMTISRVKLRNIYRFVVTVDLLAIHVSQRSWKRILQLGTKVGTTCSLQSGICCWQQSSMHRQTLGASPPM